MVNSKVLHTSKTNICVSNSSASFKGYYNSGINVPGKFATDAISKYDNFLSNNSKSLLKKQFLLENQVFRTFPVDFNSRYVAYLDLSNKTI